jgi:hypothetical protein
MTVHLLHKIKHIFYQITHVKELKVEIIFLDMCILTFLNMKLELDVFREILKTYPDIHMNIEGHRFQVIYKLNHNCVSCLRLLDLFFSHSHH